MKVDNMTVTTIPQAELEDLRAELQAHRNGIGHLAEDPMRAGQPVHMIYRPEDGGEAHYWLQVTRADQPLWQCERCRKLTLGANPGACVGCGLNAIEALVPLLYERTASCRAWTKSYGGQYDGPCLIAGSDGCDCPGVS